MEIQNALRIGHTHRWSIVNTSRLQTVAEHTCGVQLIALDILGRTPYNELMKEVIHHALFHDLAEAVIGDIPTPTKTRIKRDAPDLLKKMEMELCDHETSNGKVRKIVKHADRMEAYWWLKENGQGRHSGIVLDKLWGTIHEELEIETNQYIKHAAQTTLDVMMNGRIML